MTTVSWVSLAHGCMMPVGQPNGSPRRHMGLQHTGGKKVKNLYADTKVEEQTLWEMADQED